VDPVVAERPTDLVVARAAEDEVRGRCPAQLVVSVGAADDVLARRAGDRDDGEREHSGEREDE
jgi:hypothetical protein